MRNNLKAYTVANNQTSLADADPHFVTLKLFDGILENISVARGAIERKDIEQKAVALNKAIKIISALQDSLDKDSEPTISKHFDVLYSYSINRLLESSANLSSDGINEVVELIKPIRDAWAQMSEVAKKEGVEKLKARDDKANQKVAAGL